MKHSLFGPVVFMVQKLAIAAIQLWVVATLVFSVMYLMPGDPVLLLLGDTAPSPEALAAMRAQLGLDQPVIAQYFFWLGNALHFDFGESVLNGYPVIKTIATTLPRTLELGLAAIIIAAVIGVPLGIAAALNRGRAIDSVLTSMATVGISVPVYILGAMLIIVFSLKLDWLPSSGYMDIGRNLPEHFRRLLLPAFTLGFGLSASIARMTRSSMLEILNRDFIRAQRAKGATESRVIWIHALRNASIPIVTIIGLQLGNLMGGSVLVEAMFNWPGLSTQLVEAVARRDYPRVQGTVLAIAALFIFINLAVELLYTLLDPRIRRKGA
jgi:peptide/nickel transport system permease protein